MMQKSRLMQLVLTGVVAVCMHGSLQAAWGSPRAPAGQMCATGSYVIGFDSESNIICTEACGNGVINPGEICDDGNAESGDSCPATCQSEAVQPEGAEVGVAAKVIPVGASVSPSVTNPIISDVKPSKLTFGTRELTIKVNGSGFHTSSVIIFNGETYSTSVNQAGTQLSATFPTRSLSIGPYAITVSNGPGMEATLKRALEIY
jgi:cysteine-rich repeat protein